MKTKQDKLINRLVRNFNQSLYRDVFGSRFWLRQYSKTHSDWTDEHAYLYELIDNEQPERNRLIPCWINGPYGNRLPLQLFQEMNEFIVSSDFWEKYWKTHPRDKVQ